MAEADHRPRRELVVAGDSAKGLLGG